MQVGYVGYSSPARVAELQEILDSEGVDLHHLPTQSHAKEGLENAHYDLLIVEQSIAGCLGDFPAQYTGCSLELIGIARERGISVLYLCNQEYEFRHFASMAEEKGAQLVSPSDIGDAVLALLCPSLNAEKHVRKAPEPAA